MEIPWLTRKVVFIAFAIEDERQRDLLKGQSLHPRAPFEFIDMSVRQPYDSDWKDRVRTPNQRSDGVIALVSKNSLTSSGQKWESPVCQGGEKAASWNMALTQRTAPRFGVGVDNVRPGLTKISATSSTPCDKHAQSAHCRHRLLQHINPFERLRERRVSVKNVLERHADGTVNFATPRLLVGTSSSDVVEKGRNQESSARALC